MHDRYCEVCRAYVPIRKAIVGKVSFALAAAAIGGKASKRWEVAVAAALIAAVLGHFVDDAFGALCAHCNSPVCSPETA